MFDLISSLITPGSSTSNPSPASTSEIQKSTLQAAGLAVYDVDDYLNKPKNHALMASTGKKSPGSVLFTPMSGFSSPQPVQLGGPKTSHHVTALYHLCQSRGLVPQFEIEANDNGGFGGCLRIGNETVVSREGWLSKKDAKEALAEKGSEIVKGMEWKGKGSGVDGDNKNWVGLLMQYHTTLGAEFDGVGANFIEYALGSNFACTCTIPSHHGVYGSSTVPFPTKKAARANAAREAIQYLIAAGLTNPDGTAKARKKGNNSNNSNKTPEKAVKVEGKALEVRMDATYAQKVNDLYPILGLPPPTYHLVASSPSTPNLLSGAAYFSGSPLFPGPIGQVRNVFGKKGAKEECARGVWKVLRQVAAERGVEVEISSEEDEGDEV